MANAWATAMNYDEPSVTIWDAHSTKEVGELHGHTGLVTSVAYSPDGRWLASTSDDTTVRVWDAHGDGLARTLVAHTGRTSSVAFSPDGHQLASTSDDATVRVWDSDTGTLRAILTFSGTAVGTA